LTLFSSKITFSAFAENNSISDEIAWQLTFRSDYWDFMGVSLFLNQLTHRHTLLVQGTNLLFAPVESCRLNGSKLPVAFFARGSFSAGLHYG
jgi:hypothetical protein